VKKYFWVANNSDFKLDKTEEHIREHFEIPELTNNMRNTTNISRAAEEPINQLWDNYPEGPEVKRLVWEKRGGNSKVSTILQEAVEHLNSDFNDLLIIPLKDDRHKCYEFCTKAVRLSKQKTTVCLYGTSDSCDATTIPEKSEKLIEKIVKKKVALISSMTYVQGAEFKSVIAFLPEELSETLEIVNLNRKTFLSRGNVLLRAKVNLVIIEVR